MKILITGFEPFGGMPINPSKLLVDSLDKISFKSKEKVNIVRAILPVQFEESGDLIKRLLIEEKPDILISTGVDFGKTNIELELMAHKNEPYILPEFLKNDKIAIFNKKDLPQSYICKLNLNEIQESLSIKGFNTVISNDTGMYVCNHIYYIAQLVCEVHKLNAKCLFVHIPYTFDYFINEERIEPKFTMKDVLRTFGNLVAEIVRIENNDSKTVLSNVKTSI
jgi:pyroglutamyl-peptidase